MQAEFLVIYVFLLLLDWTFWVKHSFLQIIIRIMYQCNNNYVYCTISSLVIIAARNYALTITHTFMCRVE